MPNNTIFAVGKSGDIWHRSVDGSWTDYSIGAMGINDHLYSVHGVSETEIYAVGYTGTTVISTRWYYKWDGSYWSVWSDAPSLTAGFGPTGIFCFSSNSIFLTYTNGDSSTSGGILYWNGSSWSTLDSGTYKPFVLWGTSESEMYIGCRIPGGCEIKKWDGSAISNSSSVGGGDWCNNLSGSDGILFACGELPYSDGIWRGAWDSLSADVVADIKMNNYQSLVGCNNIISYSGKAWAFGYEYNDNNKPIVAEFDGSWSTFQLKNQRYSNNIAVCGTSSSDIVAIYGDYGGGNVPPNDAAVFLWNGTSWSEESVGDGGTFFPTAAWIPPYVGTTSTDLETKYGVHRGIFAKIHGVEPIFWKNSSLGEPSGWTRSIKTCLHAPTELSMELNPVKGMADISALTITVDDIKDSDGTYYFGKLFAAARWANNDHTWIASDVAANATSIGVIDHADFDESGIAYISGETFSYTGKSTAFGIDILTGVIRDLYPAIDGISLGKYYRYPRPGEGGGQAVVATNPYTLAGRIIALYIVTYDRYKCRWNDESDAVLTWVGRITDKIEYDGTVGVWKISCESLIRDFDKKIAYKARKSPLSKIINLNGPVDVRSFKISHWDYNLGLIYYTTIETVKFGDISDIIANLNNIFYIRSTGQGWTQKNYTYSSAPVFSIKLESGYVTIEVTFNYHAQIEIVFGDRCHLFQSLGYNVSGVPSVWINLRGDSAPYTYSWKAPNKCYESYHPISPTFNGNSLCVDDTGVFISDQGDSPYGESAAVRIQDVKTSIGTDSKATIYYRYDSISYGISTYGSYPILQFEYDHGSRMQTPVDSYAAIGSRYGDDKQIYVEQIFIPYPYDSEEGGHRGPFRMLLMMLLSTGVNGYNHATYDCLMEEFGLGIPSDLIDIDSFVNADKLIAANPLSARYLYPIEGKTFRELIEAECSLFGLAMVWQNGQFRIIEVMPPPISDYQATIDEDVIMDHIWQPKFELSIDTCINQYDCYVNFDYLSNKFNSPIIIQDVDSINELRKVLSHRIEHKGVWTHRLSPLPVDDLTTQLMGRYIRFPMPVVTLPIAPTLINKIFVGDVVAFQSDKFHDPFGSGTKNTDCYAQVINLSWNYSSWIGVCKLRLLSDVEQYGSPWAHTALVDITATNGGWDAVAYQLTLVAYEYGDEDRDNKDGNQFSDGDYVTILERDPENPASQQMWGPIEVAKDYEDDGTNILTLANGTTLTGWDATKEYIVTPGDYDEVGSHQKVVVYVANAEKKLEISAGVWELSRYLLG